MSGWLLSIAPGSGADAAIAAIAERQRARMSRGQLRLAGVSGGAIDRRLRRGRLLVVHPGVYGLPHTEELPLAAETAALLAFRKEAVLSHHSAATLWGLRPGSARPIHVTISCDRRGPRPTGIVVHRSRILTPTDIRLHHDLPVTSPARAILDVAARLPDRDIERLLDEAVFVRRLVTYEEIAALLARAGRHPGAFRLARVAGAHTRATTTESPPEERLLRLIRAAGLLEPLLQVSVLGYRLDLYWPALGLAVEVDAYGTHGSRARFEADRRRDARLLAESGIVVLRVTRDAVQRRALEVIALIARTIAQREAAALASPRFEVDGDGKPM